MSKNLKIVLIAVVVIAVGVLSINIYAANNPDVVLIGQNETLTSDKFEITIDDVYNGDFVMINELDYNFDKYLAVDLSIKNISKTDQKFNAFKKFFLDDGTDNARHFLIDENKKKFGAELIPGEEFKITLVFPVDEATEYTLFYNKSLKAEDDKKVGFTIDGTNLETKKVEFSTEHVELDSGDKDDEKEKENDKSENAKENEDE